MKKRGNVLGGSFGRTSLMTRDTLVTICAVLLEAGLLILLWSRAKSLLRTLKQHEEQIDKLEKSILAAVEKSWNDLQNNVTPIYKRLDQEPKWVSKRKWKK